MMINEGTYLINSLGEKYIYSDRFVLQAFNKGWFKNLLAKAHVDVEDGDEHGDDQNG